MYPYSLWSLGSLSGMLKYHSSNQTQQILSKEGVDEKWPQNLFGFFILYILEYILSLNNIGISKILMLSYIR